MSRKHSYICSLHPVDMNAVLGIFFLGIVNTVILCLNKIHESSASSSAINDQLSERFEVKTKELVLFAQLSGGKRDA